MIKIPTTTLGKDLQIPLLGLGTWQLKGTQAIKVIKQALKLGYRMFDTAQMYENEKEIGQAIKDTKRSELFIISKVSPQNLSFHGITESCEESLKKLKSK